MLNHENKLNVSYDMKICTPIQLSSQAQVIKQLNFLAKKADIAEIWLDHIQDLNLATLLKNKPLPVLCVCKKSFDKGLFKGSYADQAQMLIQAVSYGADYIDIPLKMPKEQSKKIVKKVRCQVSGVRCKVIFSYHNFKKTPSQSILLKKIEEMCSRGADIVKLAVMGHKLQDSLDMILLAQQLQSKKIPHILITMGQQGILTRILTPFLGGAMMFAPLKKTGSTASGQLTVKELKKAWALIDI